MDKSHKYRDFMGCEYYPLFKFLIHDQIAEKTEKLLGSSDKEEIFKFKQEIDTLKKLIDDIEFTARETSQ